MTFSQRYRYTPVRDTLQLESMDKALRNSLWNLVYAYFGSPPVNVHQISYLSRIEPSLTEICRDLWANFFNLALDDVNLAFPINLFERLKNLIFDGPWHRVYDLVEFIAANDSHRDRASQFTQIVNMILEREMSAYRFIGELIVPTTDQMEVDEIEAALTGESHAVSEQLAQALQFLSNRKDPDYRNSVKESISAVEGQVKSTLGTEKGTLGELLPKLEQRQPLHGALKSAFGSLYGYTSDEGGIRHALLDDGRNVTFEEAKFMLVACSAFINYVRGVTKS